jgi:3-oxoacyl-[acyl-carrier protein] reductase
VGRVQDKVAVVTGAAKGLGEAISHRLAQEGAKLILGDIDGPRLGTTALKFHDAGGEAVTVVGNITEEEPGFQLIENANEHFGRRL